MTEGMSRAKRGSVFWKTDGHCAYCGVELDPFGKWDVDHIVSKKNGGGDELPNLLPACKKCNGLKKAKSIEGFKQWLTSGLAEELRKIQARLEIIEDNGIGKKLLVLADALQDIEIIFFFEGEKEIGQWPNETNSLTNA